jgi:hypothetical protein
MGMSIIKVKEYYQLLVFCYTGMITKLTGCGRKRWSQMGGVNFGRRNII